MQSARRPARRRVLGDGAPRRPGGLRRRLGRRQRRGQAAARAADDARVPRRHHRAGATGDRRAAARAPPPGRARPPDRQRRPDLAAAAWCSGLGVGWSLPSAEREWAACGADHKRRVRRLEEHVEIWRMLWRGEPVTHRGGDVDLTDHTIGPLPWNAAGPPVLITAGNRGEMLPAQFDRFARLGDGIITTYRARRGVPAGARARRGGAGAPRPRAAPTSRSASTRRSGWTTIPARPSASPPSSSRPTTAAASTSAAPWGSAPPTP